MTALRAGRAGFNDRDTQGPLWIRIDVSIVFLSIGLLCVGLVVVYSATRGVPDPDTGAINRAFIERQLIFVGVGSFLAAVVAAIDYRKTKLAIPFIYAATLVLLVGLFAFGESFNGATSWYSLGFITLQPSEFAKLTLILALVLR